MRYLLRIVGLLAVLGIGVYFFFDDVLELFNTNKYVAFSGWVFTIVGTLLGMISFMPKEKSPPQTEQQRLRTQLLGLLKQVELSWVKGVLEKSFLHAPLLELDKELQPQQVDCVLERIIEIDQTSSVVPPDTTMLEVFEKEAAKSLLILGKPGAGKTTTLLQLTKELIAQAKENPQLPIPVVFNLSTWAQHKKPIKEWLIDELNSFYKVPREKGTIWITEDYILPLLDGLDEVNESVRLRCLEAVNDFVENANIMGLVVCCREAEYHELSKSKKLCLLAAIYLQPLTSAQIEHYVNAGGETLASLAHLLKHDPALRELAETPLMLNIMRVAYANVSLEQLKETTDVKARKSQLFERYISTMLSRRPTDRKSQSLFERYISKMLLRRPTEQKIYSDQKLIQTLTWLAANMKQRDQTVFLVETLQPDWLESTTGYRLLSGLLWGVVVGSMAYFAGAPLFFVLTVGVMGGVIFAFINDDIETMEQLGWSWTRCRQQWVQFPVLILGVGLFGGLVGVIVFAVGDKSVWEGWWLGALVGGVIGGFVGLMQAGLENQMPSTTDRVNQGIMSSARNFLQFGIPVGLAFGVALWLVMTTAGFIKLTLGTALIGGVFLGFLWLGGLAVVQHYVLRLMLYWEGFTPLNVVRALNYADRLILLRKVGGGFQFIHKSLLEHFADKNPKKNLPDS